ncbi:MAG: DUF1573 domain-containing protein [Bacteroidaceae bacterium]|nr:DUF1573 domain-containing protein [Bacteroidaceae bacterium]
MMRKLYLLPLFLAAVITAAAQGNVQFYEKRVDCGVVKWKEPVTATFTITNAGSRTMAISQVRPDCSCTVADWTRTPVAPGAHAQIRVTYDAELLGTFEKQVAVYTNLSDKPVYATMRGRVVMRPEAIATDEPAKPQHSPEDFNYTIGDIHLSDNNIDFDDVQMGDSPTVTLRVLNTSDTPYAPQVMHLPLWLSVTASPQVIRPGHTGEVAFRLRSRFVGDYGLTQRSVYLARFPGDVVGNDNELIVSATIVPHVYGNAAGPVPQAQCDTLMDLGQFEGKEQLKATIIVRNIGSAPLEIRKFQVYNPGMLASLSTTRIRGGGKAKLTVIATPSIFDHHGHHRLLLITNDPKHPKIVIEVKAAK